MQMYRKEWETENTNQARCVSFTPWVIAASV